jgi:ABC-type uncharacterized transport system substrate-binding protein
MAHPGANITGFASYEVTLGGKWLHLLKQMVPAIDHVDIMFNPETAPQYTFFINAIEAAANILGVSLVATPVRNVAEIGPAIARIAQQPNGGLLALSAHCKVLLQAAALYRVPAISAYSHFVRQGGLMSYHPELTDQFRQAGVYADRILKGTKPGDLPVQAPTRFILSINLNSARDLGI